MLSSHLFCKFLKKSLKYKVFNNAMSIFDSLEPKETSVEQYHISLCSISSIAWYLLVCCVYHCYFKF